MGWDAGELEALEPVFEEVLKRLRPLEERRVLTLCSGGGDLPARLLAAGAASVDVISAGSCSIPYPDAHFDAVVCDSVLFHGCRPLQVAEPELARVLKPGGVALQTDIVTISPLEAWAAAELDAVGFDYSCDATFDDYDLWLTMAGLERREVVDLTPLVERVWQARADGSPPRVGHEILLNDPKRKLGNRIFYLLASGVKPLPVEAGV